MKQHASEQNDKIAAHTGQYWGLRRIKPLRLAALIREKLDPGFHPAAESTEYHQRQPRSSPSMYCLGAELFVGGNQPAVGQRRRAGVQVQRSFFLTLQLTRGCTETSKRCATRWANCAVEISGSVVRSCATYCMSSPVSLWPDRGPRF